MKMRRNKALALQARKNRTTSWTVTCDDTELGELDVQQKHVQMRFFGS